MRSAVLREFGRPLALESRPVPSPRGEEVLVRVKGAGVCHTDLHLQAGRFADVVLPIVLGHEIAGEAEGLGDVLVYASWGCGTCPLCAQGEEQLCPRASDAGWGRDGGYAESVLVPSRRYLAPLNGLDPMRAAPLADAGITPYRAVRRARPWLEGGGQAVVIGAGGLGQFAIQYLSRLTPARVLAVDVKPTKLERARRLGAHEVALPSEAQGPARVVLDFVGTSDTLALGTRLVERGGLVMVVGEAGGHLSFGMGQVPHEAAFTTSIWGSRADLDAVLALALRGEIEWEVETLPLASVNEALDRVRRGDVSGRLVLVP
jgi:propanol-preferring alcohol dehydrogenase